MRHPLSTFTFSGLIALGLMAGSMQPLQAASAGGAALPAVERIAANANSVKGAEIIKIDHRDKYRKWRRHHHFKHKHFRRHHRPRSGIYFYFGVPGPYYGGSYYVRPRYVRPRYAKPHRSTRYLPAAHIRWCDRRYRSYRRWDNTFQPYHGPRRQCVSPYF